MARTLFAAALLLVVVGTCLAGVEEIKKDALPAAASAIAEVAPKSEGTSVTGDLETAAGHLYHGYGGYGGYGLGYGHGYGYGGGFGGYGHGWGWPRVYYGWGWPSYGVGYGYGGGYGGYGGYGFYG